MADREIVAFNPDTSPDTLETPQDPADRYIAKRPMHLEQPLTTDSTLDGRDVAADGAKLDFITVTQAVDLDALETTVGALDAAATLMGNHDASTNLFPVSTRAGEFWIVSVAGLIGGVQFEVNDMVLAIIDSASTTVYAGNWLKLQYADAVTSVAGKTGVVTLVEADISDLQAYLLAADIDTLAELNAIITDANLGDSGDFATAAQGALAATALQPENIDTLAELNAIITDATLIDTGDSRLSDSRTPTFHTHSPSEIIGAYGVSNETAYAGGGQTNATQLYAIGITVVDTVATAGDSVKLPSAAIGEKVVLINRGANYLDLFPNTSDKINQLAIDIAMRVYPNVTIELLALDNEQWITV